MILYESDLNKSKYILHYLGFISSIAQVVSQLLFYFIFLQKYKNTHDYPFNLQNFIISVSFYSQQHFILTKKNIHFDTHKILVYPHKYLTNTLIYKLT